MSEFFQDIKDYFTTRFSSPFWVSIIISWLLINWQLPITALFESENFNVEYISKYLENRPIHLLLTLPLSIGLAYAILANSVNETVEILSKYFRNILAKIDKNGHLYKSISIVEHQKEINLLSRQLEKIQIDKQKISDTNHEKSRLEEEISKLNTTILNLKSSNDQEKEKSNNLARQKEAIENELKTFIDNEKSLKEKIKEKTEGKSPNNTEEENQNLNKTIKEAIKSQSNYYNFLNNYGSEKLAESLSNPNSNTTTFIILNALKNKVPPQDTYIVLGEYGIPSHISEPALKNIGRANWTEIENGFIKISDAGKTKLDRISTDKLIQEVAELTKQIEIESKKSLLAILKDNSLHISEIKRTIKINPQINRPLEELIKLGKIFKSGEVYST